jgi:hypothetical protein
LNSTGFYPLRVVSFYDNLSTVRVIFDRKLY